MMIYLVIALQILNFFTFIILGLFIRSYLPSYLKEKGKNLATKEDIGNITDQAERVRTFYSAQLEGIRSEIEKSRDEKGEYLRKQRASLLRFYDLSIELFYEKLSVNFGDFPSDKGQSLVKFQESFFELASNLLKSYQRIVIFFNHDAKVRAGAENTLNQILKARIVVKDYFGKVKITLIEETQAFISGDNKNIEEAVKATNEANTDYWNAMRPVMDELRKSLIIYLTALNEFLRPNELEKIPIEMFSNDK